MFWLYLWCIGFHGSGTTSLEFAPGSLILVFLYHPTSNVSSSWLRLQFDEPRTPAFRPLSSHCTIFLNPCPLTLAMCASIVLNTSRSVLHRLCLQQFRRSQTGRRFMSHTGGWLKASVYRSYSNRQQSRARAQTSTNIPPWPQSVKTLPAPLFRLFRLLVLLLPQNLHRLHPCRDLSRTQGPSIVTDPKLMWEHLHPRKRRAALISPTLDERSRVSTECVRFKEFAV